jgi:transposase InsO family protein
LKFEWIDAQKANWRVSKMCKALEVTTSGFYAWRKRPPSARTREDQRLRLLVAESHRESRKNYGSPRVHRDLLARGERVSRKRVIRLMRDEGLEGKVRRRWVTTTDSQHDRPVAPNVLAQNFVASAPNERWAGDVTYLRTPDGWLYLAVILDLFSRRVVGWALSPFNDRRLALRALESAVRRRRPHAGLVHHTDQGSPYASEDYQEALARRGMTCSMSRRGNCYDNAVVESWFGMFKTELGETFESFADAQLKTFDYIEAFYNTRRRHSALGYLSPAEFERRMAA